MSSSRSFERSNRFSVKMWLVAMGVLVALIATPGASLERNGEEPVAEAGSNSFDQVAMDAASGIPGSLASPLLLAGEQDEEVNIRGEEDPEERADWFEFERSYPFGSVPAGARREAWDSRPQVPIDGIRSQALSIPWRPIGPSPTTSAFRNIGIQSGRINSIAVSPSDPRIVLVGSGTGGIWRSADRGVSFTPVSDDQVDLAVGSIAFSRSNPSIVYAGMGDTKNSYLGTGVLRSIDAGRTWSRVSNGSLPSPGTVSKIEVDSSDANRVYLAQLTRLNNEGLRETSGFYFSTDGGVNWTRTLEGLARDIAIDVSNPQVLYLGMSRVDSPLVSQAGLYRSTDRGRTWSPLYTVPYDLNNTRDVRVAVTRADPRTIYVFTGGTIGGPFDMRVVASTDGGSTWTNRGSNGVDTGQFGYNDYIAVDPNDSNTIYVGTRDVYKSTDAGSSWVNLTRSYSQFDGGFSFTPLSATAHSDQHSLVFVSGSSNELLISNDGGVWRTSDAGRTFASLNGSLSLTQFVSIAVHPTDSTISYAGSQDNGTQLRVNEQGWREFVSGDGGRCVLNPLDPSMGWFTYIRGDIFRYLNNGRNFDTQVGSNGRFGEPDVGARIAFYPPFTGNGIDATLYFGTWRLFISTDLGSTWRPPAGDLDLTRGITQSGRDVLNAIAVSRSNPNVIYTGSVQGRAMASTDAGVTWKDVTNGLPNRSIKSLTVEPTNPLVVYVTFSGFYSGHVFKSANGGETWSDLSGNLPNIPVNALLIDPLSPSLLYVGTDIGVFRSIQGDGDWQPFGDGMPPVVVNAFSAQPTGLIQVATYGRGAYELLASRPSITSAVVQSPKLLIITGGGFGSSPIVSINGVDVSGMIKSSSDSQVKIKGKAKKLGLKAGENTIQVTGEGGLLSNIFVLRI